MTGLPPPLPHEKLEQVDVVVRAVDRRGREMDDKWGFGRLPSLVAPEWAERFRVQRRKFSAAVLDFEPEPVRKHGDAMLRAYAKLDELATAAGASAAAPEQWEFVVDDQLVILVRDIADVNRVRLDGRQAQVWSLDEVASVIRAHPLIVAAKDAFPGVIVESVRPDKLATDALDDELMQVPF